MSAALVPRASTAGSEVGPLQTTLHTVMLATTASRRHACQRPPTKSLDSSARLETTAPWEPDPWSPCSPAPLAHSMRSKAAGAMLTVVNAGLDIIARAQALERRLAYAPPVTSARRVLIHRLKKPVWGTTPLKVPRTSGTAQWALTRMLKAHQCALIAWLVRNAMNSA